MDLGALFLTLAVLFLVAAYLYTPFLRGYGRRVTHEEHELSSLMAERDRVLSSLQELDFDFKLGKIPEEDYPAQRNSLLEKGADVLRKIDSLGEKYGLSADRAKSPKNGGGKGKPTDEQLESMIAARRKLRKGSFDGFCPKCGKPVMATDRFCPSCGKALN
jgi:hypothetical protein